MLAAMTSARTASPALDCPVSGVAVSTPPVGGVCSDIFFPLWPLVAPAGRVPASRALTSLRLAIVASRPRICTCGAARIAARSVIDAATIHRRIVGDGVAHGRPAHAGGPVHREHRGAAHPAGPPP